MQTALYLKANEAAVALTEEMIQQVKRCKKSQFNLAISGGRTPEILYSLWAHEYKEKIPWKKLHFYWVDERCVPSTSTDSNYGMAKHLLFDLVPIPANHIHPIVGTSEPEAEAERYSHLVQLNLSSNEGKPQFDLILLGVGTDGHTSSIFPDAHEMLTTHHYYHVGVQPMSGKKRVALTARPIIECQHVFFFVTGREKQEMVERMGQPTTDDIKLYPAVYIASRNHAAKLFYAYHE